MTIGSFIRPSRNVVLNNRDLEVLNTAMGVFLQAVATTQGSITYSMSVGIVNL